MACNMPVQSAIKICAPLATTVDLILSGTSQTIAIFKGGCKCERAAPVFSPSPRNNGQEFGATRLASLGEQLSKTCVHIIANNMKTF